MPLRVFAQLAEAMATDAAMTARVLLVVNSPFFGFSCRIETFTRALNILGMQQVHDVALAWASSSAFADVRSSVAPMKEFWRKSVARAIAARQLARQLARHARFVDAERLFVEGLLSDIGHLAMYARAPDLSIQAIHASSRTDRPLHEVERVTIGCGYAEVGAALVSVWGLPQAFHEPIACQIEPSAATIHWREEAILHVAGAMEESTRAAGNAHPDPLALAILNLDDATLIGLQMQAGLYLESVVGTIFPGLAAA